MDEKALVEPLILAAEKIGKEMSADMADNAAAILKERGDVHGAKTLTDFAALLRDVDTKH